MTTDDLDDPTPRRAFLLYVDYVSLHTQYYIYIFNIYRSIRYLTFSGLNALILTLEVFSSLRATEASDNRNKEEAEDVRLLESLL
jgi:hypothetical protein